MNRIDFIKHFGLIPFIPAITKKQAAESIPEGYQPLINLGVFSKQEIRKKIRENRKTAYQLATNTFNTLENIAREAIR